MLQTGVEQAILGAHRDGDSVFPAYGDYCFANVNPTLVSLFGAETNRRLPETVFAGVETDIERIVVLFLDGYGWEHWKRDCDGVPLLSAFADRGTVTPLTSIYPSETVAATTTFHTGRTPVEHGLLGWWQYVEEADAVIQSLPFLTLDGEPADDVYPGLEPETLFDGDSLYERAAEQGVRSRLHHPFPADGPENAGAETTVYENVADLRGTDALWKNLQRDEDGDPIPPVGSPRNLHLFLQDGTVDRVREAVASRFPCRTYTRAEAIETGLFGDREPSDLFRRRCGDLVVVHRDRGVWWEDDELALAGMHGGLTREEMLVPFAAATLGDLRT